MLSSNSDVPETQVVVNRERVFTGDFRVLDERRVAESGGFLSRIRFAVQHERAALSCIVVTAREKTVGELLQAELTRQRRRTTAEARDSGGLTGGEDRASDDEIGNAFPRQIQCLREHDPTCDPRTVENQIGRTDLSAIWRSGLTVSAPGLYFGTMNPPTFGVHATQNLGRSGGLGDKNIGRRI